MDKLWILLVAVLLVGCSTTEEDPNDITSKFDGTWNIHESCERQKDGSITYTAIPWGGLVGAMREHNLPVDWSKFESISVEFAQPTKTTTQLKISSNMRVYGKPGITSLVYYFDGQDVRQIDEVVLQTADSCNLEVKRIFLTPGTSVWNSTPIWEGNVNFENFQNSIRVAADQFNDAQAGDQIEFLYKLDQSDPSIEYWNIKTIFDGTNDTLEGNVNQLNEWGCASLGSSGVFRIRLTAGDIKGLRKKGMHVVGYYGIISQVNLLKRGYTGEGA